MENNQSPPFHHPYGAHPPHPSHLLLSPTSYYHGYHNHQTNQLSLVHPRQPQSQPSLPPLPDAALLAKHPLTSGYAFALPPVGPDQSAAALYQHQSPLTPSQASVVFPVTPRGQISRKGTISSSSQSRHRTPSSSALHPLVAPASTSSLPQKPKKPKTPARIAREMARKLKHRERRRLGRRERRNASRKGDGESEGIAALEGENAYQSDMEDAGSESGELDTGSPVAANTDKYNSDTDGEGSYSPMSSTESTTGDRPLVQTDGVKKDDMTAPDSTLLPLTLSEGASGLGPPPSPPRPSNLDGSSNFQQDNLPTRDPPMGPRFQPPTGPRNNDTYPFGIHDRGNGRQHFDDRGFRFETDSRGLYFPQTESGFRERKYRDNNRRPGDRRGFHSDAPQRFDGQRGARAPLPAHDRPILHLQRSATPEQFPAMVAAKRQRMDEDGEAEMDIDSPDGSETVDIAANLSVSDSKVNQDVAPNTVLEKPVPQEIALPSETTNPANAPKKFDVISMIREAKKSLFGNRKDISSSSGDFISLSGLDDESGHNKTSEPPTPSIPTGPEFSHRDFLHSRDPRDKPPTIDTGAAPGTTSISQPLPPPPGLDESPRKKKRTRSEMSPPPVADSYPWLNPTTVLDHSSSLYGSVWLHKEIIDFYNYIRPRPYEHAVRQDLVHRLRGLVQKTWPDADLQAFGSFAAEIYLPTSDIDVVILSKQFCQSSRPRYNGIRDIRKLARALQSSSLPKPGTVVPILGAKVPIIKYKDRLTGLSVDISFENPSGLVAIQTFKQWRKVYPEMPKLALLLKHFLSIRKTNEPFNGGLGSFSVICMVVSLLQMMPEVSSGNINEGENVSLGRILMEFLELYGDKFNVNTTGISVRNPGYFKKTRRHDLYNPQKPFLMCIEDPNDPKNNISKASYKIKDILQDFSHAYLNLNRRLNQLHNMPLSQRTGQSVLAPIIGGFSYKPIADQRDIMQRVFLDNNLGTPDDLKLLCYQDSDDPLDPIFPEAPPPDVFDPTTKRASRQERKPKQKKEQKKMRRAAKVKGRVDESGVSTGPSSVPGAGPSNNKKKKEKKPKEKETPVHVD